SSGLDPAEVERMRKEAEAHADEEKRKVEVITAKNEADQAVYLVEKMLKEHGAKLGDADKAPIQAAVEKTKEAAKGQDAQAVRNATSDLKVAWQALARCVQQGGAAPGGEPGAGGGKDNTIDAEYEVKK